MPTFKFKCWDPDVETVDDANECEAADPCTAAEEFVRDSWTPDDGEHAQVCVQCPDGIVTSWDVYIDIEASFNAFPAEAE
jgi:hypothetical protein